MNERHKNSSRHPAPCEHGRCACYFQRRSLVLAVGCLGFSAFLTQVTLMRELLSAFSGNELIFGVVLGNWMLLTGIGAAVGKTAPRLKSPWTILIVAQVLVALLPIADVFLLRTLRNVIFIRGAEVGVTDSVITCFVLLAPYCLVIGYLLTLASWFWARDEEAEGIGRVYFLDNVGSVLGGIAFSFLLVHLLSHFAILYIPACLNLLAAAVTAIAAHRRWMLVAVAAVTIALAGLIVTVDLDQRSTEILYAGQRIAYRGHSPYGSVVVTQLAGQTNFMENGTLLFSTQSVEQVEETVHYAMAQRPQARRVLLVSGGASGTAREILKYGVEAVDYVELDPMVIEAARRCLPESLDDPRIRVAATDGRLFVKQTRQQYDVVILDVPDPSTSQLNRFYTREFFAEVHRVLSPGGVVSFSLGQNYDGYLDSQTARMLATAYRTVSEVFGNVLMIPGGRICFLASDDALTTDVAQRIEQAGVATRWVNRRTLAAMLTPDRMADLRRAVSDAAPSNRDFSPILYYYHLRYWMSQFQVRFGLLEAALLALLAVYLVRLRPVPLAIFATGFAASALEVVLLFAFQILYGSVYHQVGLIVTMFMLGLGLGSWAMNRRLLGRRPGDLAWLLAALALYAACLPAAFAGLERLGGDYAPAASQVAIPALTLLLAVLVGTAFPLAAKLDFHTVATTASRLYTADYVGASLGALFTSTLLIPLLGVTAACLLTAGLCLLSVIVLAVAWKKR